MRDLAARRRRACRPQRRRARGRSRGRPARRGCRPSADPGRRRRRPARRRRADHVARHGATARRSASPTRTDSAPLDGSARRSRRPMDPFGDTDVDASVELAMTSHRATGDRRGSILINPGGPGGDGLSTAWGVRGSLSADLLRSFDIVSWDPRGVGESTPKIDCDDEVPPGNFDFIDRCVELTGPLSGFLAAPYSAADMEAIRIALGEDELNYLGYSYGAILGATYAAAAPDRVGRVRARRRDRSADRGPRRTVERRFSDARRRRVRRGDRSVRGDLQRHRSVPLQPRCGHGARRSHDPGPRAADPGLRRSARRRRR